MKQKHFRLVPEATTETFFSFSYFVDNKHRFSFLRTGNLPLVVAQGRQLG